MEPEHDDRDTEERWILGARGQVETYLARQSLRHGAVAEWPAFHVAPVVSVWAVESLLFPGRVGWWVIHGDLPTDYVSADGIGTPREAVAAFASRWADYVARSGVGCPPVEFSLGDGSDALLEPLEQRARSLQDMAADDALWEG